jgi:hypothetical protein
MLAVAGDVKGAPIRTIEGSSPSVQSLVRHIVAEAA